MKASVVSIQSGNLARSARLTRSSPTRGQDTPPHQRDGPTLFDLPTRHLFGAGTPPLPVASARWEWNGCCGGRGGAPPQRSSLTLREVRGSGRENLSESELRKKARGTGGRQTGGEEADGRRRGGQGKAQQQQRADSRRQEGRGEVEIEEAEQHNQSWFNSILVTIEDNLSYFDIDFNIFTEAAEQQQHGTENAPLLELVEAGVGHTDEPSR